MTAAAPAVDLDERVIAAEAEVAWLEDLAASLRDGTASWREWDDSLTCHDRQGRAAEECAMALDEALRSLAELTKTAAVARPGNGGSR